MGKFIVGTFLLLGWTFYEMSGGADFEPQSWPEEVAVAEAEATVPTPEPVPSIEVTRAVTPVLTSVSVVSPAVAQPQETIPAAEPVIVEASAVAAPSETSTPAVSAPASEDPIVTPVVATVPSIDLRQVSGSWVNMRSGPGTGFDVLDTLPQGTEAEVIEVDASGWARIRVVESGQMGWMAERLLTEG